MAKLDQIHMKVSELVETVNTLNTSLVKAKGEILGKIAQLENADGELTQEQTDAIQALRDTVQSLDDVVPDTVSEKDVTAEDTATATAKKAPQK